MNEPIETVRHSTQPRVRRRGTINYADPNPVRQADNSNVDPVGLALALSTPLTGSGLGIGTARTVRGLREFLAARQQRDFMKRMEELGISPRNRRVESWEQEIFDMQFQGPAEVYNDASTHVIPGTVEAWAARNAPRMVEDTMSGMPQSYNPSMGQMQYGVNRYEANSAAQAARDALRRLLIERGMGQ